MLVPIGNYWWGQCMNALHSSYWVVGVVASGPPPRRPREPPPDDGPFDEEIDPVDPPDVRADPIDSVFIL